MSRYDQTSHVAVGAEYQLIFEGHDPLVFDYLGAARDRAKEAPPENAQVGEVAADTVEDALSQKRRLMASRRSLSGSCGGAAWPMPDWQLRSG